MPNRGPKQTTIIDLGIGSRIALLRTAHGLSRAELASALGVSFQQVQKYESGKNRVGISRLRLIADRLGVPVASFFDGDDGLSSDDLTNLLAKDGQAMELLRAYASIHDDAARQDVLAIVETAGRLGQAGTATCFAEAADDDVGS